MTIMTRSALLLELNVDTGRLFSGDPLYAMWVAELVTDVADERERQMRKLGASGG